MVSPVWKRRSNVRWTRLCFLRTGKWLKPGRLPGALALFSVTVLYQATYEYIHYCMHIPKGRWVEKLAVFRWLNDHHLQHHRKHFTNLNVVLPIADFILRTRVRCADPASVAITREVGYIPAHRLPPRGWWVRKAASETWAMVCFVSRRLFRTTTSQAG